MALFSMYSWIRGATERLMNSRTEARKGLVVPVESGASHRYSSMADGTRRTMRRARSAPARSNLHRGTSHMLNWSGNHPAGKCLAVRELGYSGREEEDRAYRRGRGEAT